MLFPNHMPFQYFLFDTYPGYFLQILPFAVFAGLTYAILKFRRDRTTPLRRKICSVLFVCYLTELIGLALALDLVWNLWYRILYRRPSGESIRFFSGAFNFVPDFFRHMRRDETIGNILAFIPFGVLYPLSKDGVTWKRTVFTGFLCSAGIEILQPIVGRAFDVNDLILNTSGALISASVFYALSGFLKKDASAS